MLRPRVALRHLAGCEEMSSRSRLLVTVFVAFAGALVAALVIFSGDDQDACGAYARCESASELETTEANRAAAPSDEPPARQQGLKARPANPRAAKDERKAVGPKQGEQATDEGPSGPAPTTDPETQASNAVTGFLRDLDRHNGGAVCRAFAPGALDAIRFPQPGADCVRSVERSLGYRDPRGLPVWESSEPTGDISAQIVGDQARVTATVVTDYEDQRDPSVEDDVLYLRRSGNRWLLLKPSATFYRAIGIGDVPLEAFKPPAG